jgi:hypothetical protein
MTADSMPKLQGSSCEFGTKVVDALERAGIAAQPLGVKGVCDMQ